MVYISRYVHIHRGWGWKEARRSGIDITRVTVLLLPREDGAEGELAVTSTEELSPLPSSRSCRSRMLGNNPSFRATHGIERETAGTVPCCVGVREKKMRMNITFLAHLLRLGSQGLFGTTLISRLPRKLNYIKYEE